MLKIKPKSFRFFKSINYKIIQDHRNNFSISVPQCEKARTEKASFQKNLLSAWAQRVSLLYWESLVTHPDIHQVTSFIFPFLHGLSGTRQGRHHAAQPPRNCTKRTDLSGSRLEKHKTAALPNVWSTTKVLLEVVQGKHGNMNLQRCLLRQKQLLISYKLERNEVNKNNYLNFSVTISYLVS